MGVFWVHPTLLGFLIAICLGCHHDDSGLTIDGRYSEHLSVLAREYEAAARQNAATTVKVVQVYESDGAGDLNLRVLSRSKLLYETRHSGEIGSLFQALQKSSSQGNCDLGKGASFVVVAFDRDLPRVGIIRLYECDSDNALTIGVRPTGDAALDYSAAAASYLRTIGIVD